MSRDEVPAEVRALATTYAAKFISKDDNDFAELHGLFCAAIRAALASRPAAPATDAEVEPVVWVIPGDDNEDVNGFIDAKVCREGEFTRPLYARPAPASQAVEEVRREAAEDERDRLMERAIGWKYTGIVSFLQANGAMLPADRQRARAGQDGGA